MIFRIRYHICERRDVAKPCKAHDLWTIAKNREHSEHTSVIFDVRNDHEFNGVEDNGGFQPIVSMWFKGNMGDNDHGLEARLFYKGQQIATTAGNNANVGKDSSGGGQRATEQCVLNANLCHWQRFTFQWPNVRVDNGGTFNRDYYPNATYIDKNAGDYVVKVFKNGAQIREATFTVGADGRVADGGYHKPGHLLHYKVLIPVKVIGTSEKYNPVAWKTDAYYGNLMSGFVVN